MIKWTLVFSLKFVIPLPLPYNYAQNSIIKSDKPFKKVVNMNSCTF